MHQLGWPLETFKDLGTWSFEWMSVTVLSDYSHDHISFSFSTQCLDGTYLFGQATV